MSQEAVADLPDWSQVRLHIVTGKGGAGKTTVSAALALTLASLGRRVLLCEVEGRQGISQALDVPPLGPKEERVVRVSGGGEVWGLSVEAKAALIEYLSIFYHLGSAGGMLERLGAIDFATTIAPGVRDVLSIGKVYEAVTRETGERRYDAVVLDAPPTGRVLPFLNVNEEVAHLAKVGPIRNQAASITRVLKAPSTKVHVVTLLEEMPVQETVDAVAELRSHGFGVGAVVVNQARSAFFTPEQSAALGANPGDGTDGTDDTGSLDGEAVARALAGAGLTGRAAESATGAGLLTQAREHVERIAVEDTQLAALDDLAAPVHVLPHVLDPTGASSVRELAQSLADQGVWG
ncbi:ArsA-related P-loop ATPase [Piscicoccus intestinalis]|uniref:ArsA-related P-loop ATPase n=1 Tax=Piscicoccus intestinalis TaxID=746033 RepID=UPI000837B629|nr:ArsA-related P-loop ATPase [Piscicoccus intestinalis]